jgi:aminoglycoside phosphotransferase family enzyme
MDLVAALLDPAVYPDPTTTVSLVQTHISWVFITDDFAYKVKKPVDLGFLNFTTLRRRHFYLHQELALNRRLCPEIYLEVLPIVAHKQGVRLGGPGQPVEYALKMVRLPQEGMMDEVAHRGELRPGHLERIIERLVPFYEAAATGPRINKFGDPAIIHFNHQENFSRTAGLPGEILSPDLFDRIKVFSWDFLKKNRQLFLKRIREGRIRDCHGDLHMKNICLADGVYIYDCIEFNPRFRYGDVAADIDFLAMDLDFHGYRQLSRGFVQGFARASRDLELLEILDFYKCYRAYVRGKINAFVAQDPAQSNAAREQAGAAARAYFALAGEYAQEGAKAAA